MLNTECAAVARMKSGSSADPEYEPPRILSGLRGRPNPNKKPGIAAMPGFRWARLKIQALLAVGNEAHHPLTYRVPLVSMLQAVHALAVGRLANVLLTNFQQLF